VRSTGELWGTQRRNTYSGLNPQVKAHEGRYPHQAPPPGYKVFEFVTHIEPDTGVAPGQIQWSKGKPGVTDFVEDGKDWAKIPVTIIREIQ
jgi:hypothetical protein